MTYLQMPKGVDLERRITTYWNLLNAFHRSCPIAFNVYAFLYAEHLGLTERLMNKVISCWATTIETNLSKRIVEKINGAC